MRAYSSSRNDEVFGYWHFDRHPDFEDDKKEEGKAKRDAKVKPKGTGEKISEVLGAVHPRYHFQFGGNLMRDEMKAKGGDFGLGLILESPRLAHPPMDAVLAIDFVLANYLPGAWRELTLRGSLYGDIVRRAQRRYWIPYVTSLRNWCDEEFATVWHPREVWPSLVCW